MIGGAHVLYSDNSYHDFIFVGILCVLCVLGHFILFLFLIVKSLYTDIKYYIIELIPHQYMFNNHSCWLAQFLFPVYSSIQPLLSTIILSFYLF